MNHSSEARQKSLRLTLPRGSTSATPTCEASQSFEAVPMGGSRMSRMMMQCGRRIVVGRASLFATTITTRRVAVLNYDSLRRVVFSTTTTTSAGTVVDQSPIGRVTPPGVTRTGTKKNEKVDHRRATMIARRNMEITNLGQAGRWEEIVAMFRQQQQQGG